MQSEKSFGDKVILFFEWLRRRIEYVFSRHMVLTEMYFFSKRGGFL